MAACPRQSSIHWYAHYNANSHSAYSVQADAFNVFNWVRFASPNLNITNANFGRITAVANSPGLSSSMRGLVSKQTHRDLRRGPTPLYARFV